MLLDRPRRSGLPISVCCSYLPFLTPHLAEWFEISIRVGRNFAKFDLYSSSTEALLVLHPKRVLNSNFLSLHRGSHCQPQRAAKHLLWAIRVTSCELMSNVRYVVIPDFNVLGTGKIMEQWQAA